mmetsp:Transcript_85837/g.243469  ORF Transcript_85837/g.243469 Transcript_85837/m.243469 type:complete len:221 (-) Transcript_85837:401-1063(-)
MRAPLPDRRTPRPTGTSGRHGDGRPLLQPPLVPGHVSQRLGRVAPGVAAPPPQAQAALLVRGPHRAHDIQGAVGFCRGRAVQAHDVAGAEAPQLGGRLCLLLARHGVPDATCDVQGSGTRGRHPKLVVRPHPVNVELRHLAARPRAEADELWGQARNQVEVTHQLHGAADVVAAIAPPGVDVPRVPAGDATLHGAGACGHEAFDGVGVVAEPRVLVVLHE